MPTRATPDAARLRGAVQLNENQKANVFVSSRMSRELAGEKLGAIRRELKGILQAAFPFLNVELAEDWTAERKGSARELSVAGARWSDLMVGILVDAPGHRDRAGLHATELELATALEDSWDKVLLFAHKDLAERVSAQPDGYRQLVERVMGHERGKIVNEFDTKAALFQLVVDAVAGHAAAATRRYPSRTSGKSTEQTAWELMTFTERHGAIHDAFKRVAARVRDVGAVLSLTFVEPRLEHAGYETTLHAEERSTVALPTIVSVCPDRFSFAEAARFVGYPFRTMTEAWTAPLGPLHITGIYRTITGAQIRKHLGNPDIRVAKEPWGFFARDPERSIQGLFLTRCEDETALRTRLHDALEWLSATSLREVIATARARGRILAATGVK